VVGITLGSLDIRSCEEAIPFSNPDPVEMQIRSNPCSSQVSNSLEHHIFRSYGILLKRVFKGFRRMTFRWSRIPNQNILFPLPKILIFLVSSHFLFNFQSQLSLRLLLSQLLHVGWWVTLTIKFIPGLGSSLKRYKSGSFFVDENCAQSEKNYI
jgi:hypothetical protein